MRVLVVLLFMTQITWANGERAGDFDYYVLSLSWSPNWCALEGNPRSSPQCEEDRDFGWILHGLWPQYETGWPSHCRTTFRNPTRAGTAAMADIMGTSGLAWYQWKKHGRCSGLSWTDYFDTARRAYRAVNRPSVFRKLTESIQLPASVIEDAFLQANPDWQPDMITITCRQNRIQEARLCLTKELSARSCGTDVIQDCTMQDAVFDPID